MKKILLGLLLLAFVIFVAVGVQTPKLERVWSPDQALLPSVVFEGEKARIQNVRNFEYRSETDYTPAYYNTEVDISGLRSADYIVEPFGNIGAAHTFLSFGFADGQQIAISIEIRKEVGETFSALKGILRQYELMYVIADERDVIGLRAVHRQNPVYVYPANVDIDKARVLFRSMLERASSLTHTPEFYNTVVNNCTTNIARHINDITEKRVPLDLRLLLPKNSDLLAKELGFIAEGIDIETARERYMVNERAERHIDSPDFSARIRELEESLEVSVGDSNFIQESIVSDIESESLKEVLLVQASESNESASQAESVLPTYLVTRVIDGDTIEVAIGGARERVRYIGIDTPETVHPSKPVACYGKEASNRNKELVQGKYVQLERDISDRDKYGRLLRYVYIDGVMVNHELVAEGYANVVTYPPDVRNTELFLEAEREARTAKRGLWGEVCQSDESVAVETIRVSPLDRQCVIKGNISQTTGEKIYHIPGCDYYSQTIITESAGEQWFCTEDEAVASGWRKAKNCPG